MRATDLNQGVVYGIETEETALDERLATRFDYDEVFGTALNRFCVQAVIGHPLTVYGKGGQTRGYLNIVDTLRCVELAVTEPRRARASSGCSTSSPSSSRSAAGRASSRRPAPKSGWTCTVDPIENPRVEMEEHYYNADAHEAAGPRACKPHLLSETLIESMFAAIERHKDRVILDHILPRDHWRPASAAPERVAATMPALQDHRRPGRTGRSSSSSPRYRSTAHQPAEPDHHVRDSASSWSRSRSRRRSSTRCSDTFNFQPPGNRPRPRRARADLRPGRGRPDPVRPVPAAAVVRRHERAIDPAAGRGARPGAVRLGPRGVAPRRSALGDRVARLQRGGERRRGDQGDAADGGGLPRRAGGRVGRFRGPDGRRRA